MSETIVAPAKRWIELHIDLIPIDGSQFKEVQCSDAYLEEIMIRFAQAHVEKALDSIKTAIRNSAKAYCDDHTPFYGPCVSCGRYENTLELPEEDEVIELISTTYPIENVK